MEEKREMLCVSDADVIILSLFLLVNLENIHMLRHVPFAI